MGHSQESGDSRLESVRGDRHSEVFLDAQWLGREIRPLFTGQTTVPDAFCLWGSRVLVRASCLFRLRRQEDDRRQDVRVLRRLVLTFPPHNLNDWEPILAVANTPDERARSAQHISEGVPEYLLLRRLVVEEGDARQLLEHPKPWRVEARKELRVSRDLEEKPLPFFARHQNLYFDKNGPMEELGLQIFLTFAHWGFAKEPTNADLRAIVTYICAVCDREEERFRPAAEQAASYLFTNWVMPQRASDFRAYVRRVAFDHNSREVKKRKQSPEQGELENERSSRGKERTGRQIVGATEALSVRALASRAGVHHQRIDEAIKAGKLRAKWQRGRRLIERLDAERFLKDTEVTRAVRATRKTLIKAGKAKEAETFRKRIYRLKKSRASDESILEAVREAYKKTNIPRMTKLPSK